jgi:hypothetical protein
MTAADIRDAIVLAAAHKGWTTKDIEPGLLEATLQVRQHVAVVAIPYSATSYGINYKDSVMLRYDDGEIHGNYNRWISNLKRQIERQIRIVAEQRPR